MELLLILILFGDPQVEPLAGELAQVLRTRGADRVRVLTGADANAALRELGVSDGDLIADPAIATQLTAARQRLVLVRLDRRDAAGTAVVEATVWNAGRSEPVSAMAPTAADAQAAALAALLKLLDARVPATIAAEPASPLSQLAGASDWAGILRATETPDGPRAWYYRVQALMRLGRDADARTALAAMRAAHAGHALTDAAAALVPAAAATTEPQTDPVR